MFVINVPGVRGVIAISLYLAWCVTGGFALIAVYLVLVNGIAHAVGGLVLRGYNPGLVTAVVLFFPLGAYALWQVPLAHGGTLACHAIGLLIALTIHAAIVAYVNFRKAALSR